MKMARKLLVICLAVLALSFLLVPSQAEAASISEVNEYVADIAGPTLVKYDGTWYYVKNGRVDNSTTLVKYNGTWFYVSGGTLQNKTTLCKYNGKWYYVENGKLSTKTTLVKYNGTWFYVSGGTLQNKTTLCKYNGKWYYVENGKLSTKTTLVKYNGTWFYVSGGTLQNKTTLCKYNGTWFYVENGKVDFTQNSLYKFNGYWFLVQNGKVNLRTTTLYKFNGKWYYIENGKVCGRTTLIKYNGIWYYVSGGTLQNKTTLCFYRGQWYYVENGKLSTKTVFVKYGNDRFYVSGGTTHPELNGRVEVNGKAFYVCNGILTECHSYGHCYTNATCTEPAICIYCAVPGTAALGHSIGDDYYCERCGGHLSQEVTIKVWTPYEDHGWLAEMQSQFETEHPEYSITWANEYVSESDAGSMVINDPESAADVYMFAHDQLNRLLDTGGVMQLGGSFAEQVRNDNSEFMVKTVTWTDGGIYGFPVSSNTWFMYYDKSVFTEEDVQSLDTMLEKGRVSFPEAPWYSGTFFLGCGCTLFGENGNDASAGIQFGGEKGYLAARKMIELATHDNMFGAKFDGIQPMIEGSADASFSGYWDYATLKEVLGDNLGIAMLPTFTAEGKEYQMTAMSGSKCVGVNPNANNPQVCAQFAAFLASEEAQLARYEMCGVIPAHKNLRNHSVIGNDPLAAAQMDTITYASVVQPGLPEMGQYWTPVEVFCRNIFSGEINMNNYIYYVDMMMERLNAPIW